MCCPTECVAAGTTFKVTPWNGHMGSMPTVKHKVAVNVFMALCGNGNDNDPAREYGDNDAAYNIVRYRETDEI